MTRRIFRSILLVAIAVQLAGLIVITATLYNDYMDVQDDRLKTQLELIADATEVGGEEYLARIVPDDYRVTWVNTDGSIRYDSQAQVQEMENHAEREEIKEAFETGEGESARYSTTIMAETKNFAVLLGDGSVLRISANRQTVPAMMFGSLRPVILIFIAAIVLSAILADRISKRIVTPLNTLALDDPLNNDTYEELTPLLTRIELLRRQTDIQLEDLKRREEEFTAITENMSEGLVLLNDRGVIVSINPAAQRLLGTDASCVGKYFLTVDRNPEINSAINSALKEGHREIRVERSGREYQFDISRIESDDEAAIGVVLLAFDVTEQAYSQRIRQEFTANVSHELKTPLQSIMGSAELIENGLVKPEDISRFVGRIRTEAARLVVLIEDIIRLSQLDEGSEMPREAVDLYTVAQDTLAILEEAAAAKTVKLSLNGASAVFTGVYRLVAEIVFNLCDNAIKYNVAGGTVTVSVSEDEKNAVITVADTGIGIPLQHQSRIFERFYRVDKSHSKESGGTGLGLSIVKHAAQYHNAKIELRSEQDKGTVITVAFPK